MAKLRDPIEIYRESLADTPPVEESHPPVIQRADVRPYPDLSRLWVRAETSAFAAFPNLEFFVYDPDGQLVSHMLMVEIRQPYQSVTLHLRQSPRPGARYRVEMELTRDEDVLDTRAMEFDLIFEETEGKRGAA